MSFSDEALGLPYSAGKLGDPSLIVSKDRLLGFNITSLYPSSFVVSLLSALSCSDNEEGGNTNFDWDVPFSATRKR